MRLNLSISSNSLKLSYDMPILLNRFFFTNFSHQICYKLMTYCLIHELPYRNEREKILEMNTNSKLKSCYCLAFGCYSRPHQYCSKSESGHSRNHIDIRGFVELLIVSVDQVAQNWFVWRKYTAKNLFTIILVRCMRWVLYFVIFDNARLLTDRLLLLARDSFCDCICVLRVICTLNLLNALRKCHIICLLMIDEPALQNVNLNILFPVFR